MKIYTIIRSQYDIVLDLHNVGVMYAFRDKEDAKEKFCEMLAHECGYQTVEDYDNDNGIGAFGKMFAEDVERGFYRDFDDPFLLKIEEIKVD